MPLRSAGAIVIIGVPAVLATPRFLENWCWCLISLIITNKGSNKVVTNDGYIRKVSLLCE